MYTLCNSLSRRLSVVLNQRVREVPFHDLSVPILPCSLFALALICGETHFRAECRLRLINAAYLVAFGLRSVQIVHTFVSTLTFSQKFPMTGVSREEENELKPNIRSPKIKRHLGNSNHGHFDSLCELKVKLTVANDRIFFIKLKILSEWMIQGARASPTSKNFLRSGWTCQNQTPRLMK